MPSHRGHQKKLEKKKKERTAAQKKQRAVTAAATPASQHAIVKRSLGVEVGPVFMSASWRTDATALVSVVVTRHLEDGTLVAGLALVDRGYYGIKNSFVSELRDPAELTAMLDGLARVHGDVEEVSLLEAQSVIFRAVDFARSVGHEPHPHFAPAFFGPRPEVLLEAPGSGS